jgi:steroid 5-alpha reductase family enzyme
MTLAEIAVLLGLTLALSLAAMTAAWAVAWRTGAAGFIDGVWPLVMVLTAGAVFLLAEADPVRKGLLLWLTGVWALREAWRGFKPAARKAANARYARVGGPTDRLWRCFLPQGALAWLTALPAQLGQMEFGSAVGWIGWSGAGLAVAGMALAGMGDLGQAMRRPARGAGADAPAIWRGWLSRPDYVGDIAVWWGLFLIAAETGPGRWSIVGPVFLTLALGHWIRTENPRRERDGG